MSLWMLPTVLIVALITIPPAGSFAGLWGPQGGFFPFFIGIFLALVSGIGLAAAAAYATVSARPWRGGALRGAAIPLLVVTAVFLSRPDNVAINDISTDLDDRPGFAPDVAAAPGASGQDPELLAWFADAQREHYPEVRPILLDEPPGRAFERALEVARAMPRWQVTRADAAAGAIEATAESRIFRFVDDVSIRVRPDDAGARVDVRSRSRIGRGDLGANAARILAYAESLQP